MDVGRQRLLGSPEAPGNRQGGDLAGCLEGAEAFLTLPTPAGFAEPTQPVAFPSLGDARPLGRQGFLF